MTCWRCDICICHALTWVILELIKYWNWFFSWIFWILSLSMFNSDWKSSKYIWIDCFEIIDTFLYDFSVSEIYKFLMQINIFLWTVNEFLSVKIISTWNMRFKKSNIWLNFIKCKKNERKWWDESARKYVMKKTKKLIYNK